MIKIKNLMTGNFHDFEITIFPDKTSQVWKINATPDIGERFEVQWEFENEAEIFHLVQIGQLLNKITKEIPSLYVKTLPYARQDKLISNNSTFALTTLMDVLRQGTYTNITTIDAHSLKYCGEYYMGIPRIVNIMPTERIRVILKESDTDLICFPDKGASKRGYSYDEEYYGAPIILDKERNQETGQILGLKFTTKFKPDLTGYKVCIIDDLCDGGGTFIGAAKLLKEAGAKEVYLYTTHGIYSKGVNNLFDNGIDKVYNYNGEVKRES